jgi:hypothetical protein
MVSTKLLDNGNLNHFKVITKVYYHMVRSKSVWFVWLPPEI